MKRLLVILAVLAAAAPAHAQSVEAEALFREGRRLLDEGRVAEACEKLEASERLETAPGTLFNLADCRERNGQLATAWATFLKAEAAAKRSGKRDRRAKEAARRSRALEPRLSYLTISVRAANRLEGLVITRDGATVDPALWNTGVPIDAGTYAIAASAPGHGAWSTEVTIDGEAQRVQVEVPRFKAIDEPADPTEPPDPDDPIAPDDPAPPPDDEPDQPSPPRSGRFTSLRWGAVAAGALGVGALGAGIWRGLGARDLQAAADRLCPEIDCTDPEAVRLNQAAQGRAREANLLFVAAPVALGAAALLWWLGAPAEVEIDDEAVVVSVRGGF